MIEPARTPERRAPVPPQMALRVAVMGAVALMLFAVVFFRLWYLQVLSGDQYVQQADSNRLRSLPIPAPRGDILDRNGLSLATDRLTPAVEIDPTALPAAGAPRLALYRELARVLHLSARSIESRVVKQRVAVPYANVVIQTDPGVGALTVLAEQQGRFPGVTEQPVFIRQYPDRTLAAQVLGYVGQVGPTQLKQRRFRGVHQGAIVGQYGVELAYDRYLRGRPGAQRVEVNSMGQAISPLPSRNPLQGHDLKLSLDLGLQKEGQDALIKGMGLAQANGNPAPAGAFVALDPRNGEVLAMGSTPSFDPNVFAKPFSQTQYKQLIGNGGPTAPLFNRAISGGYPTGSTFKPITAMAALMSGLVSPDATYGAGACIKVGAAGQQFCNAGHTDFGPVDMRNALKVSSDTYFYTLGEMANGVHGEIIQTMARKLGLGRPTGIDLPGEASGVVPDAAWRARQAELEIRCENRTHKSSCGISDKRPWSVGDNVNFAVGQGDLEASPLQMATVYATLENGGRVVRPHLGMEVDDSQGRLIQRIAPPPSRHVALDPAARAVVLDGLHAAASEQGGTSADVWAGWDQNLHPIYGKTGTAEHGVGQPDQSWYVCFSPDRARPIVIAVTIEGGGFGAQAAAPAARLMMSQWFGLPRKLVVGHSLTL